MRLFKLMLSLLAVGLSGCYRRVKKIVLGSGTFKKRFLGY